ncbi:MAG: RNA 2',3'-cyclic phosphodiesterase [Anaerolineales bacterium]
MSVIRAFIAIDLASDVVKHLARVTEDLQARISPHLVRWSSPENIHLTLKFLGDVSVQNLPLLKDALRAEAASRSLFDLSVGGLGAFPKVNQPRVIWVGVEAPDDLSSLQRAIENQMERLGYERQARPFAAHLTLGRVSRNVEARELRQVAQVLQEYKLGFLGVSRVTAVHLYRSDLTPDGAIYTRLFTAPLRPAAQ